MTSSSRKSKWRRWAFAVVLVSGLPSAGAQVAPSAGAQRASRAELAARLATVEQDLANGRLKDGNQNRAKAEVAAIQQRLRQGDSSGCRARRHRVGARQSHGVAARAP